MDKLLQEMIEKMQTLDGTIVGTGNGSWKDTAKELSSVFRKLANRMDKLAEGNGAPFQSFNFEEVITNSLNV